MLSCKGLFLLIRLIVLVKFFKISKVWLLEFSSINVFILILMGVVIVTGTSCSRIVEGA